MILQTIDQINISEDIVHHNLIQADNKHQSTPTNTYKNPFKRDQLSTMKKQHKGCKLTIFLCDTGYICGRGLITEDLVVKNIKTFCCFKGRSNFYQQDFQIRMNYTFSSLPQGKTQRCTKIAEVKKKVLWIIRII